MIISMFWEDIFSLNVSLPYDPLVNADTISDLLVECVSFLLEDPERKTYGSNWYHFNAFCMAQPGSEPMTS